MAKVKVAVYGTLRKGDYNFDRFVHVFGEKSMKYLKTVTVATTDYALVTIRDMYPGLLEKSRFAARSYNVRKAIPEVTFDLLEIEDNCYSAIYDMETSSGYKESTINIENTTYKTFLYQYDDKSYQTITSGDWLEYKNGKKDNLGYKKGFSAYEEVSKAAK